MTVRYLEYLFNPRIVALLGPAEPRDPVAAAVANGMQRAPFHGHLLVALDEVEAIEALAETPELAVLNGDLDRAPALIEALGRKGCKVVLAVGAPPENPEIVPAMLAAAHPFGLRIVGPGAFNLAVPAIGLQAVVSPVLPQPGRLAFITHSNGILDTLIDWAAGNGIGISRAVSLGAKCDVDLADVLDFLALDHSTGAIIMYLESITRPRKFMSALRAAARIKPVVVLKAGRFGPLPPATTAIRRLADADAVFDAVLARAGCVRVDAVEELFDAAATLGFPGAAMGDRLAILANGYGAGLLAADHLQDRNARLAELSSETLAGLASIHGLKSDLNPIDIGPDAEPERYAEVLPVLTADRGVDGILVVHTPSAVSSALSAVEATLRGFGVRRQPRLIACFMGETEARAARAALRASGIPTFSTPRQAARAIMHMVAYRRNQELLAETPASMPADFSVDSLTVAQEIEEHRLAGREWVHGPDALRLLSAYGFPTVRPIFAATPAEAAQHAKRIGATVVLKIATRDPIDKKAVGGVTLGLDEPDDVHRAAELMMRRVTARAPQARIDGFTVEPMVILPDGHELLLGFVEDEQFGPVVVFGNGGTACEVIRDRIVALPPLNMALARHAIGRTRVANLLSGGPGRPGIDSRALELALLRVAQIAIDHPEIIELEINPLVADPEGVIVLDARFRLAEASQPGSKRLAIRPYPKTLEEHVVDDVGDHYQLRPIRPEDERPLIKGVTTVNPEHLRLRFFAPMKELSHAFAAKLTQIDYDREMAFVLMGEGPPGEAEWFGTGRLVSDPDGEKGEYAVIVRSDRLGRGLGRLLMERIISYGKERGLREIYGEVLRENRTMLQLAVELGFVVKSTPGEPDVAHVVLKI
ncbi:acetate--CoA ligase family protein [Zavarzinia aquatilis]|uniref:GNAT family N-acetyltransferase n=1 Tax=Zavarzinia aquatilis TaxID=2211142 RepID=A0A317EEL6_9PROT|nr:GNAT family N-acetyltransferase [Zavarzinia aquatilis]PWR24716.1 GNAT family N-acetyltransferase [Zavarzinia aquatilis]